MKRISFVALLVVLFSVNSFGATFPILHGGGECPAECKGEKGDPGPQGPIGPQGLQGEPGKDGVCQNWCDSLVNSQWRTVLANGTIHRVVFTYGNVQIDNDTIASQWNLSDHVVTAPNLGVALLDLDCDIMEASVGGGLYRLFRY